MSVSASISLVVLAARSEAMNEKRATAICTIASVIAEAPAATAVSEPPPSAVAAPRRSAARSKRSALA